MPSYVMLSSDSPKVEKNCQTFGLTNHENLSDRKKSVRPNKIEKNQRITCVCISKTLFVLDSSTVKIGTFLTAHFHLHPIIHQRFTVLLLIFIKFCLRSILLILLLLFCAFLRRRFFIFPRFGTFSDAILYTWGLDKSWTVGTIRNKNLSDLIKIYRTCPSDRHISGSL
jgi:hypothetical protein